MKKVTSKRLVIDACVARSAGETDHPISAACRGYLLDILAICHKIVMTLATVSLYFFDRFS